MSDRTKSLLVVMIIIAVMSFLMIEVVRERNRAVNKKATAAAVRPKVTEASIKFGEQYEVHDQEDITIYVRDIYLTAPAPYEFAAFVLGGFVPSGKAEREKFDIQTSAFEIMVFIDDSKPVPFRRTLNHNINPGEVLVASEYIAAWTTFKTEQPVKITVAVPFACLPEIGKTEYHLSLKEFWAVPENAEPETHGRGYKPFLPLADQKFPDFLVARCP